MHSTTIKLVGPFLFHRLVKNLSAVELPAEVNDRQADDDVTFAQRLQQGDSLQRCATRQSHIGLSAGKSATHKIKHHMIEREALTLVDRQRPSGFQGYLHEGSQHLLLDLLLLFVIGVLHVFPHLGQNSHFGAVLQSDKHPGVIKPSHTADGTVVPASFLVVTDEYHLCAHFENQVLSRRQAAFRKILLDNSLIVAFGGLESLHVLIIDGIDRVATGGQCDGKVVVEFLIIRVAALIQARDISTCCPIDAHAVEQRDELAITLTINLP